MSAIFLGTSGWQHRAWQQSFYPGNLDDKNRLPYYASQFECVEIVESFFRLPDRHTFAHWIEITPEDFRFTVVAPRVITHYKKLKGCENQVATLVTRLRGLGPKIGAVVFQLPPRWRCNLRRLEEFARRLPDEYRYVFEFRDPTWHNRNVYQLLEDHRFALSVEPGELSRKPLATTSDIVYLRLPSPKDSAIGSYHPQTLRGWAGRARGWTRKGKSVYIVFDGEDSNAMLKNTQRIRKYINQSV